MTTPSRLSRLSTVHCVAFLVRSWKNSLLLTNLWLKITFLVGNILQVLVEFAAWLPCCGSLVGLNEKLFHILRTGGAQSWPLEDLQDVEVVVGPTDMSVFPRRLQGCWDEPCNEVAHYIYIYIYIYIYTERSFLTELAKRYSGNIPDHSFLTELELSWICFCDLYCEKVYSGLFRKMPTSWNRPV